MMTFPVTSRARQLVAALGCALLLGAASACLHSAPRDAASAPDRRSGESPAPADAGASAGKGSDPAAPREPAAGGQATGEKSDRDRPAGQSPGATAEPADAGAAAGDAAGTATAGVAAGGARTRATPDPVAPNTASESGRTSGSGPGSGTASGRGTQAAGPPLQISLALDATTLSVGDVVGVDVMVASAARVVDAPLHLLYDPAVLRYFDAAEGEFLKQDGTSVVFLVNGQSRAGDVALGIGRTDRSRGAAGGGRLCRVRFVALAPGVSTIRVGSAMAWGEDGAVLAVSTGSSVVTVR